MRHCQAMWVACPKPIRKTAIFTNVFGKETRLGLCAEHMEQFKDVEFRQKLLDSSLESLHALHESGMTAKVQDMVLHPAQIALLEHQKTCVQCSATRDWIVREQTMGRITTPADIIRVGEYVVAHCCEVGVQLNYETGQAMQGSQKT